MALGVAPFAVLVRRLDLDPRFGPWAVLVVATLITVVVKAPEQTWAGVVATSAFLQVALVMTGWEWIPSPWWVAGLGVVATVMAVAEPARSIPLGPLGLADVAGRVVVVCAPTAVMTAMALGALALRSVGPSMFGLAVLGVASVGLFGPRPASTPVADESGGASEGRPPPRDAEPRRARTSVLLVPLVGIDAVVLTVVGLKLVTALVVVGVAAVAVGVSAPTRWAAVERPFRVVLRPVDLVIDGSAALFERFVPPAIAGVHRFVKLLARWLGLAVRTVLLSVVWVVAILVPWLVQRIFGWDPVWAPTERSSTWVERGPVDQRFEAIWRPESAERVALIRGRRRRYLRAARLPGAVAAVALLVAGIVVVPDWLASEPDSTASNPSNASNGSSGPTTSPVMSAHDAVFQEPWYPEFDRAMKRYIKRQSMAQYAGLTNPTIHSRYLNVSDGWRRSWKPPAPSCGRRLRVWVFGGSTTWGEQQRDDFTISSEIAKAAWAKGIAVDVLNGGVHADVAWQQELRLERALAVESAKPDLVIFYDGFNDYIAQNFADAAEVGGVGTFVGMDDPSLMPVLTQLKLVKQGDDATYTVPAPKLAHRPVDNRRVVPAALFQYEQAANRAKATLSAKGIAFAEFFQPALATRSPVRPGDADIPPDQPEGLRMMRAGLAADVVDLASVLDSSTQPLFVDPVHTLEAANPPIAAAMVDRLSSSLTTLAHTGGVPCS